MDQHTVLFVETQGQILQNLPLDGHQSRHRWQSIRVNDTAAALDIISRRNISVVVFNLGPDLEQYKDFFAQVHAQAATVIQCVLMVENNQHQIADSLDHVHQSIAANCKPAEIVNVINRGLSVWQRTRNNPQLAKLLANLNQLPTPPTLYFDLRDELESTSFTAKSITEIISRDQALSARLLKVVNSGFYAVPRTVMDLNRAVTLLGNDIVLGLVLMAHLFDSLPLPGLNLDELWKHNLTVSALARHIAAEQGGDRDIINASGVAGLLHDLGGLVLLSNLTSEYHGVIRRAGGDENQLWRLEQEQFAAAHPEIGALVLELWNMPDLVVEAVALHHQPPGQAGSLPARALSMAEWLVNEYAIRGGVYAESPDDNLQNDAIEQVQGWWEACGRLVDCVAA